MKKTIAVGIIVVLLLSLSVGAFLTLENTEEEKRQIDIPFSTADDPGIDSQITSTTLVDENLLVSFNNPNHEKVYVEGLVADRYTLKEDKLTVFNYNNEPFKLIIGEQSDEYGFGYPVTTYGNGWKKVCSPDGGCTHTDGVKTYLRWDGNYRPWSELNFSSGDWSYTVTEFDNYYIIEADGISFKLPKRNWIEYEFGLYKIKETMHIPSLQSLIDRSVAHNATVRYIPLPFSPSQIAQVDKNLVALGRFKTKDFWIRDNGTEVFDSETNTTYWGNHSYYGVANHYELEVVFGETRLYFDDLEWFQNANYPLVIDPTWIVGSGDNAWSGNVSHDGTTEVQSTGDVELRQEVDDYVSYWRMDKGTGNTAYDENETSNNDGSFTDGSTGNWTSSSKYGDYALDFDGINDYVDIADTPFDFTGDFSIIFIVKFNNLPSALSNTIVSKAEGGGYSLEVDANNKIQFAVHDGADYRLAISNDVPTIGNWYHISAMVTGTEVSLHVDGNKQTTTGTLTGLISTTNYNLMIGVNPGAALMRYFNGTIDEVMIYNRTLSNNEINQTTDNEHHTSGNLTSWHDAGSGNETHKLSVNFTFPANTNASINLYNNDTGAFIETLATNNNTAQWSKTITSAVQDSKVNITLYGNVSETPEIHNITFHTQSSAAADTSFTVTLPSGYTYAQFEPSNSTAQNVTPNGQSASQEFYNITNTGNVNLDVHLKLQPEQNQSAYWSMDEGVGTWVNDTSGNNNNGTWYGNTTANWTSDTPFGSGYALDFDGVDDFVNCSNGSSLDFGAGNFTIGVWVTLKGGNEHAGIIVSKYNYSADKGWYLQFDGAELYMDIVDGTDWLDVAYDICPGSGVTWDCPKLWWYIMYVRDGSVGKLYIDGSLKNTGNASAVDNIDVDDPLLIGAYDQPPSAFYNNTIGEVMVYSKALDATEAYSHYKNWFNQTPYNTILKADSDNNPTGATEINTTLQTLYTGLTPNSYADIWLWSDFDHTPQQATNRTLSINVTQS